MNNQILCIFCLFFSTGVYNNIHDYVYLQLIRGALDFLPITEALQKYLTRIVKKLHSIHVLLTTISMTQILVSQIFMHTGLRDVCTGQSHTCLSVSSLLGIYGQTLTTLDQKSSPIRHEYNGLQNSIFKHNSNIDDCK